MATQGYVIYTIGLGNNGSVNTELQNCAANGGFFEAATPTNLQSVFNDIAKSLIALRLSQIDRALPGRTDQRIVIASAATQSRPSRRNLPEIASSLRSSQ